MQLMCAHCFRTFDIKRVQLIDLLAMTDNACREPQQAMAPAIDGRIDVVRNFCRDYNGNRVIISWSRAGILFVMYKFMKCVNGLNRR